MKMPLKVLAAALVLLPLGGCITRSESYRATERIAEQYHEHVYATWTNPQGVELVTRDCPTLSPGGWDESKGEYRQAVHATCVDVPGTTDPADVEFWKFDLHYVVQHYLYGAIPVSPKYKSGQTTKVGVVGSREACEAVRIQMDRKPQGVAGDETTSMTEACTGPYYFRRVP